MGAIKLIFFEVLHSGTRQKPRDLAVDKIKILFDNQIQQKHSICVVGRFAVSTYRRRNEKRDDASVVNGKASNKSMQKRRGGFWCVKTLTGTSPNIYVLVHVFLV